MADAASLRFRLYDGTDLGPLSFPLGTTVGAVKDALLAEWPQARQLCRPGLGSRVPTLTRARRAPPDPRRRSASRPSPRRR